MQDRPQVSPQLCCSDDVTGSAGKQNHSVNVYDISYELPDHNRGAIVDVRFILGDNVALILRRLRAFECTRGLLKIRGGESLGLDRLL